MLKNINGTIYYNKIENSMLKFMSKNKDHNKFEK